MNSKIKSNIKGGSCGLKMLILQGPPCCGKSTFVKNFLETVDNPNDWVVINRDAYRYEIGNGKYTMKHEDEVTEMENSRMDAAINNGKNIIVDNTNLNPKTLNKLNSIADKYDYEVEIKDLYIPYKEAMERSKKRKEEGGLYISNRVMTNFYTRYYPERLEKEMTDYRIKDLKPLNKELPNCVIVDLDGTIALHKRSPFDWVKIPTDTIDSRMFFILTALQNSGIKIIFLTGRPEIEGDVNIRDLTIDWLIDKGFIDYTLLMRQTKDFRHGDEVKKEIYENEIKGKFNVIAAFDDSNKCASMWRSEGVLCLQPELGDY